MGQSVECLCYSPIVPYKLPVKVTEAEERPDIFFTSGYSPVHHCLKLRGFCGYSVSSDNESQELGAGNIELAFLDICL